MDKPEDKDEQPTIDDLLLIQQYNREHKILPKKEDVHPSLWHLYDWDK